MSIFNSNLKTEDILSALKDVKKSVRFIGILGAGMYPLARLLVSRGYRVSGYDSAAGGSYINAHGIEITDIPCYGVKGVSLVVYSLAIDENNPEILFAKSHGMPLISRAQLLGALMSEFSTRICVSGSHGKSTITAIIDHIFKTAGLSHTCISGATLMGGDSLYNGGGDVFLAEACEYKDSFLQMPATHQLITSVELDHTDYFADTHSIRASFALAAQRAGTVVIEYDSPISAAIADDLRLNNGEKTHTVRTYGKNPRADYRICDVIRKDDTTVFTLSSPDESFRLTTSLIGQFNFYNISAAVAMAHTFGLPREIIERAIATFSAIERRMTPLTHIKGIPVYYDYAHHPTEIGAVISALKEKYGAVTVIFRPHTYTRTKSLWRGFVSELGRADLAILLDIYPAREEPIDGVSSQGLAQDIPGAIYTLAHTAAQLAASHAKGVIVLLGAGEVDSVRRDLIDLGEK